MHEAILEPEYEVQIHKRNITRLLFASRFRMFGRSLRKFGFDARQPMKLISDNPQSFYYVHNFKVHYKQSPLQLIARAIEVSVRGESPQIPLTNWVTYEFDKQIRKQSKRRRASDRYIQSSYRITNIEYIGSTAIRLDPHGVVPTQGH